MSFSADLAISVYSWKWYIVRKLELEKGKLILSEDQIKGFLVRTITPLGMSGKADIPRRYTGRGVYLIITKNEGTFKKEKKNE